MCFISTFSLFLVFKRDFIRSADFIRRPVSASNTASDDVTNYATNRILNTNLLYSCAHFVVKIMKLLAGFNAI